MDDSPEEVLPQRMEIGGRWAMVAHLDDNWKPVTKDKATMAVALFDDGGKTICKVTHAK